MKKHSWYEEPHWARLFLIVLALTVSMIASGPFIGCNGIPLPDSDGDGIPDVIDPCPDNPDPACVPDGGEGGAYDCANPPEVEGQFFGLKSFTEGRVMIVLRKQANRAGKNVLTLGPAAVQSVASRLEAKFSSLANVQAFTHVGQIAATANLQTIAAILKEPQIAYVRQVETYTVQQPLAGGPTASWGTDRVNQRGLPLDWNDEMLGTGEGVHVVINDTGITDHLDFEGRLSADCGTSHGTCQDGHGHGTHCAGTVGGKTFGVAKKVTLHAYKCLNNNGSGTTDQVVAGIDWAVALKERLGADVKVVGSMSLGGPPDPPLDQAVCDSIAAGVQWAIAAGNDYGDSSYNSSPSRVVQAVTVAASNKSDQAANFSNVGPGIDVWAPGEDIVSASPGGGSATMSGTSMATPHVAGALALCSEESPAACSGWIGSTATPDKLSGVPGDTENRLLFVGEAQGPSPPPACPEQCPEGQSCTDPEVGCVPDEPPQPPPVTDCLFNTPTAEWMIANGYNCSVTPKKEGRKGFGSTPTCNNWPDVNGQPYYCQPGLWPEACVAGRRGGPPAPDGHPNRPACEAHFFQQPCATFSFQSNEHMSYDPWISIDGVNQNHPRNVRVCGQGQFETHPSWVKEPYGPGGHLYIVKGQWSWATAHGNGKVCAEAKDGVAKKCVNYVEQ